MMDPGPSLFHVYGPPVDLSLLLGPRMGLRSRRRLAAQQRAAFVLRMPANGTLLVTFTTGREPAWNVEALEGMGLGAVARESAVELFELASHLRRLKAATNEHRARSTRASRGESVAEYAISKHPSPQEP